MAETEDSPTVSLSSLYKETIFEHDRTYQKHSFEKEIYCVPIDEEEEERLEIQDGVFNRLFDHRLFLADIADPVRVLDCGYGQAQWILSVAHAYEDCQVDGIDIFPLELPEEPTNLSRYCDDLNQPLTETFQAGTYDVIQSRFVSPGIHKNRWRSYVMELSRLLKPGGMLQMIEYYYNFQSHSGKMRDHHALFQWGAKYRQAMSADRDLRIGSADPRGDGKTPLRLLMEEAGLESINQEIKHVPIGDWPSEAPLKQAGVRNKENVNRFLDSFGTWPFIQRLGMTKEEVKSLNDRAREEIEDPEMKAYLPLTAVWGKRRATGN